MKTAKAVVEPGACGLKVVVLAELDEKNRLNIKFHSACKQVAGLTEQFQGLNWKKGLFAKICDSYVYKVCTEHLKHVDCPVPSAVLKTVQVLVGAAVEQEVHMKITLVTEANQ